MWPRGQLKVAISLEGNLCRPQTVAQAIDQCLQHTESLLIYKKCIKWNTKSRK